MIHGVRVVICRNNRFLLCQHNQTPQFEGDIREPDKVGHWSFPGGHLEHPGEPPEKAVARELREEFGIKSIDNIKYINTITYTEKKYLIYSCGTNEEIDSLDKSEIEAIDWFSRDDILQLSSQNKLHTGYELELIDAYLGQKQN